MNRSGWCCPRRSRPALGAGCSLACCNTTSRRRARTSMPPCALHCAPMACASKACASMPTASAGPAWATAGPARTTRASCARPGHLPAIVVAHNPDSAMDLLPGDAAIVLAGHTHGGQIRIPWLYRKVIPSAHGFDRGNRWRRRAGPVRVHHPRRGRSRPAAAPVQPAHHRRAAAAAMTLPRDCAYSVPGWWKRQWMPCTTGAILRQPCVPCRAGAARLPAPGVGLAAPAPHPVARRCWQRRCRAT
jgi:hypothetical protein